MKTHGSARGALALYTLCFSGCDSGSFGTLAPSSTGVEGTVIGVDGQPIAGAIVVVSGNDPVTTDAMGSFRFADVDSPFDLTVIDTSATTTFVRTYTRLRRRLLRITELQMRFGVLEGTTVSGSAPVAPGKVTRVFFSAPHTLSSATADPLTGEYSLEVFWEVPPTTLHGNLYVLRSVEVGPQEYDGFAARSVPLDSVAASSRQDFAEGDLVDPPDRQLSGSVTRWADFSSVQLDLDLILSGASLPLQSEVPLATDRFDFVVPDLDEASFNLRVLAARAEGGGSFAQSHGIAAGAADVEIDLQTPPEPVSPEMGAMDVDGSTSFEWSPASDSGVHGLWVYPIPVAHTPGVTGIRPPRFEIYVQGSSARLPDLAPYGWGLPPGVSYRWSVLWSSSPLVIDDVVSPNPPETPPEFQSSWSEAWGFSTRADSLAG